MLLGFCLSYKRLNRFGAQKTWQGQYPIFSECLFTGRDKIFIAKRVGIKINNVFKVLYRLSPLPRPNLAFREGNQRITIQI